jgi:hypothetical protein
MIKDEEKLIKKKLAKEIIEKKKRLNQTLDFDLIPKNIESKYFLNL